MKANELKQLFTSATYQHKEFNVFEDTDKKPSCTMTLQDIEVIFPGHEVATIDLFIGEYNFPAVRIKKAGNS